MRQYSIASIPGDGIGPEVVAQGIRVLNRAAALDGGFSFTFSEYPWGCEFYQKHGKMMDDDGMKKLADHEAIFLGAVGFPGVPDHISLWDLLLKIRKGFDQYVNLRPIKLLRGAPCPLKGVDIADVDMLVVRENSEGEYAGEGSWLFKGQSNEVVLQTGVFSRKGTERIIRYAYEAARSLGQTLTSVSKGNALNYSMVFWDDVFREVGREYPDVATTSYMVDAASMFFIREPQRFQVVVTSNLFGDILTDLGAAIAGGMGLAAGANINPERKYPSMFEPIHGSAPDIAGQNKANPFAAIWSASQMLDHLGRPDWGKRVLDAIEAVLMDGATLTPDMGGTAGASDVADAVLRALES